MTETFFADDKIIFTYTRAQAIEDGVLADVSEIAKKHGFKYPVAVTEAVWEDCIAWSDSDHQKAASIENTRLMRFLRTTALAIKNGKKNESELMYSFSRSSRDSGDEETIQLKLNCGPGDNFEPVLTIMFPDED